MLRMLLSQSGREQEQRVQRASYRPIADIDLMSDFGPMRRTALHPSSASQLEIQLRIDDLSRLFEPLDASALSGRHLDERIEKFIVHRAQERPDASFALIVEYSRPETKPGDALAASVQEHFAHLAGEVATQIAALIREGKKDLLVGLSFLFLCALLGLASAKMLPAPFGLFVEQGLLIIGWVALWRPLDLFLYELRPLKARRLTLAGLAKADVQFEHL